MLEGLIYELLQLIQLLSIGFEVVCFSFAKYIVERMCDSGELRDKLSADVAKSEKRM